MNDAVWRFDPVPASGAIAGGAADTLVFKPHLASFVREVLQNSHDQRSAEHPVEVEFVFREYSPGSHSRSKLEDALGWDQLLPHLQSVARGKEDTFSLRVDQALQHMRERPLVCLEITDRNTCGLTGGEFERGANFAALCRNVLDTPPGNKPGRGGSYGLGKAVLWLYSSLSTIVFSSRLHGDDDENGGRTRLIGRSVLPYHEVAGDRLSGLGWLGRDADDSTHALSLWDGEANELAARLDIERGHDDRPGTSILLVGFREPYLDAERPVEDVASDVLDEAKRWFWPAMNSERPSLWVSTAVVRDGVRVQTAGVSTDSTTVHFTTASNSEKAQRTATTAGVVAEREIDFTVPALIDPSEGQLRGEHTAKFRLRVVRSQETDHEYANHVALVRGARMVVDYTKWGRSPADGRPFFAVLEAGLAHGDSDLDHLAEDFLRRAEPPAHDSWELTDGVRLRFERGGGARLRQLANDVRAAISEICADEPPSGALGPSALAKLFAIPSPRGRGGVGGSGASSPFAVDLAQPELRDGVWHLRGAMRRTRGSSPWHATVKLLLDAESGSATALPLVSGSAIADGDALAVDLAQESLVIWVPDGDTEVELQVSGRVMDEWTARRTRLVADVRPKSGGKVHA